MRPTLTLSLLLAASLGMFGQSVSWQPGAGSLAFEQVSQLQLVFENCQPKGQPDLPAVDGLVMQYTGSGSSFSMENANITRKYILSYAVRPTKRPEVRIPGFTVETDKGPQRVPSATFAVGNATLGRNAVPIESAVSVKLTPESGEYWAGEVFPLEYTLEIAQRFRPRQPGPIKWDPAPLTVEDWGQPEITTRAGTEPRVVLTYRSRGCLSTPGTYRIPAASQDVVLVVDSGGNLFSFPFSSPEMVQHTVTSNQPMFKVKPLPGGAPAGFAGAVGQFTITSKVVPTTVAVGEPITPGPSISPAPATGPIFTVSPAAKCPRTSRCCSPRRNACRSRASSSTAPSRRTLS